MMWPALILAGGFGTRLKSVVPDLPKPLADINGKPFLWWLLRQLEKQGVTEAYLSVGYLHEHIQDYFGDRFNAMKLHYIIETEPLGTGGAIMNASQSIPQRHIIVLNGDTLAVTDLKAYIDYASQHSSKLFLAAAAVEDASRYGTMLVDDQHRISGFAEKGRSGNGLINAGVYLLDTSVFKDYELARKFSFETDLLTKHIDSLNLIAYDQVGDFIDIGIPEDYAIAQHKVPALVDGQ